VTGVLVRANALTRAYGPLVAVDGASCEVRSGEHVVLTGFSGSGKSTLLHLLAGLERPSGGWVEWPDLGSREDLRPCAVATIFQGPSLLPPLNVVENVALPLVLGGTEDSAAQRRARSALFTLGIESLADKLPEELSGGQAQRVAVARVLAGEPRLVFADEPTGQLDQQTGQRMLDVLDEAIAAIGATLVITTHDQRVAARYPRRWTMVDGRLSGAA